MAPRSYSKTYKVSGKYLCICGARLTASRSPAALSRALDCKCTTVLELALNKSLICPRDSELKLVGEYGLRNKREVWRVQLTLSKIRRAARYVGSHPLELVQTNKNLSHTACYYERI
jgi:hypothetical protein